MTFPLVWVKQSGKHQFAAHLLESKKDVCKIRSMNDGFCKWVPTSAVTRQLPPRQRRRPVKFKHYVNPASDESMQDVQEEEEEAASVKDNLGLSSTEINDDEETASMNSSSLSSLTHSSQEGDNNDALDRSSNVNPPTDAIIQQDNEYLSEPSVQGTSISASQPPLLRCSTVRTSDAHSPTTEHKAPAVSALRAIQSIGGTVGNRVKSLFSWKRFQPNTSCARKRPIVQQEGNSCRSKTAIVQWYNNCIAI